MGILGWRLQKRYDPPKVNNDYNAEWHTKGICRYLSEHKNPHNLVRKLIGMLVQSVYGKE
jgi:hypothetical protein